MSQIHVDRQPGIGLSREATHRQVLLAGEQFLPGGKTIDGSLSRDPLSGNVYELAAGLLMGKITASGKYAPSVIGATAVLHDTSVVTTTMTLPAAVVTELQRRIGLGDFKITGPPTAGGTNATETLTIAAFASATTITLDSASSADFAAGSIITPEDGSETPITMIPNGFGIRVVDEDLADIDVPFSQLPIAGLVDASQIRNWASFDASVKAAIISDLNSVGQFVFDHQF